MNDILNIKKLAVRRGGFLLDKVSMAVREEEIFALIGKTGSGKTVLLESIAGFGKSDSGTVLYQGKEIHSHPSEKYRLSLSGLQPVSPYDG